MYKRQLRSDSRNVKRNEMKIFTRERERNTYAFSACRICSFASSIFDIFLRMVPTFSSAQIPMATKLYILKLCMSVLKRIIHTLPSNHRMCMHTDAETNLYTYRSLRRRFRDCEAHNQLSLLVVQPNLT